jgi:hypothetical protein
LESRIDKEKKRLAQLSPLCIGNGVRVSFSSTYFTSSAVLAGRSPDFLFPALDMTACAAFSEKSRMKFDNVNKASQEIGVGLLE